MCHHICCWVDEEEKKKEKEENGVTENRYALCREICNLSTID